MCYKRSDKKSLLFRAGICSLEVMSMLLWVRGTLCAQQNTHTHFFNSRLLGKCAKIHSHRSHVNAPTFLSILPMRVGIGAFPAIMTQVEVPLTGSIIHHDKKH